MPTQEDRIAELEQKMTTIELERLYEKRKASENTPTEQAYNYSTISHNLTLLLGIASGQEHAIKLMQGDLEIIKERGEHQEQDIGAIKDDLGVVKGDLG